MKKNQLSLCCICLQMFIVVIFLSTSGIAQTNEDSVIYQKALKTTIDAYKLGIRENLRLFNGPLYSFATKQSYGSPFWDNDSLMNGDIYYDDNYYKNIPLKYDLVNQIIVTINFDYDMQIALLNDKIKSVTINNHQFFWIDAEKNNYRYIRTGLYERLYNGSIIVWAKRTKELKLGSNAENQIDKFKELDQYFIQRDRNFYIIKDKKEIIETLINKHDKISRFISEHKLNFDKNLEASLIIVATYYDQLKN